MRLPPFEGLRAAREAEMTPIMSPTLCPVPRDSLDGEGGSRPAFGNPRGVSGPSAPALSTKLTEKRPQKYPTLMCAGRP